MFSILGAIGNLFFGFKSGFQVWKNYKTKSFECSIMMILFDFVGNICCGAYIAGTTGFWTLPWQFVNYTLATLFIFILLGQYFYYNSAKRKLEKSRQIIIDETNKCSCEFESWQKESALNKDL